VAQTSVFLHYAETVVLLSSFYLAGDYILVEPGASSWACYFSQTE
jgi:hypothetical protein